jgi:hypothetical protein
MPKFGSPFPTPVSPRSDREEAPITVEAQAAPGEVALDAVVRAQSIAPQLRQRIADLENSLWALADFLERLSPMALSATERQELRHLLQRAREAVKARLELDDEPK